MLMPPRPTNSKTMFRVPYSLKNNQEATMNKVLNKTAYSVFTAFTLLGLLTGGGCTPSGADPEPGKQTGGYLSGRVVDTQGKPLPGVTIIADNTMFYNNNILATSDANGNYRIQTPNGSWVATAQIRRTYNGKGYMLDLEADKTDAFSGNDGAVRNFQWKLSGEKPDYPGAFYGGTVDVTNEIGKGPYDTENIDFTFTPVGPLIDGSIGKPVVYRYDTYYNRIPDVPIGRYKISAIYKPTGTKLLLRNRVDGTYSADGSATMDFYGEIPYWSCTNCMFLEYKEP
ncbi:carboxypeptidase regulatory-like domain-containing protein [Spirosoma sp. HMF3257]|uniref:Carboxypeptidase regulatory-like domain-containing protein n=1 Tax=Spirosoma telluris TaxID=2183553 RepID=A0A327NVY0_9BACT|nr:carboxypeptidase regulatory-like domain-containing protein [Spirosoma telluris]RAI78004.1 carboxypeptidase regulatory-like domain-containing protein [Spirosoma telluris]